MTNAATTSVNVATEMTTGQYHSDAHPLGGSRWLTLFTHAHTANFRRNQVRIGTQRHFHREVEQQDGSDHAVGARAGRVGLAAETSDETHKEDLEKGSDEQERSTADLVEEKDGDEAADEREGLGEDIVGEGLRGKAELNVEGGAVAEHELTASPL